MSKSDNDGCLFWGIGIWFISSLILLICEISDARKVYVSTNNDAEIYHKEVSCLRLYLQKGRIYKIKKGEAKEEGFVKCDRCYK
jgi:hypothetical protein